MMHALLAAMLAATPNSLELVPEAAHSAIVVQDAQSLAQGIATFSAQGRQKTLMTLWARARQKAGREFGIDVMDPQARAALGTPADAPFAIVRMAPEGPPILVLPAVPEDVLLTGLKKAVGSAYVRTTDVTQKVAGATLHALTVGEVMTPRLLWATVGDHSYLAGPRSKQALRTLVDAPPGRTVADNPQAQSDQIQLGPHQLYAAQKASPGGVWHLSGLSMAGPIVQARSLLPREVWGNPLCRADGRPNQRVAQQLAALLQPQALLHGSGATTKHLLALGQTRADTASMGQVLGPAMAGRLGRLWQGAPKMAEALSGFEAPFAWALYAAGPQGPAPGAPAWADRFSAAVVVRAVSVSDKARMRALGTRLRGEASAQKPGGKAKPKGQAEASVHHPGPGHGYDLAVLDDTLLATFGPGENKRLQARLHATTAPGPEPQINAELEGTAHLDALAQVLKAAIMTGAQGPLKGTPLESVPQLLLVGPTGDLINDLEDLGRGDARILCSEDRAPMLNLTLHQGAP